MSFIIASLRSFPLFGNLYSTGSHKLFQIHSRSKRVGIHLPSFTSIPCSCLRRRIQCFCWSSEAPPGYPRVPLYLCQRPRTGNPENLVESWQPPLPIPPSLTAGHQCGWNKHVTDWSLYSQSECRINHFKYLSPPDSRLVHVVGVEVDEYWFLSVLCDSSSYHDVEVEAVFLAGILSCWGAIIYHLDYLNQSRRHIVC